MEKTDNLDPAKIEAITTTEGPLLIIAGPGSGKTKTLVERVVHLINDKAIPAENIMIATFTEKAAKELITRVSNRLLELDLKVNLHEMYIGTLHSIFLRFLEEHREYTRLKRNYRMLDDFDQKFFLYQHIKEYLQVENAELLLESRLKTWDKTNELLPYLNKISEECLDAETLIASSDPRIQVMGKFHQIYTKQLSDENALDFSSIQSETLYLLESQPQILKALQDKIKYIMVDEYQDTNTIQEKILLLLANQHHNICVVGDDDQGLYRFRGATIRNILEFPQNFSKGTCKQVTLTVNYRSHPDIIDFYNNWMELCNWEDDGVKFRYDKTIKPRQDDFPDIHSVIKVGKRGKAEDYYEEVYQFIKHLEKKGVLTNYNQIAFLFKSVKNDKVIGLANYLESRGIDIFSPRSDLFFEREEVQLLLGALIFIFPTLFQDLKWSEEAELSVWETYESWKAKFADELREDPLKHKDLLKWCQNKSKQHLALTENTNYGFAALLYQLLEYPMFSQYLDTDLNGSKINARGAYNVAMLSNLLGKFEYLFNVSVFTQKNIQQNLRNFFNIFLRFIIEGGIEEYEDFDEYAPSGCVSFMTIHQSKGLEFPIVFVGSLNLVPKKQYDEIDEILQKQYYLKKPFEPIEKTKNYDFYRLFYTAFSRPQNLLVLTAHENPDGKGLGKTPSKYFDDVYDNLVSWRDNDFDVSELKLENMKTTNIKHEYSFTSHILLYEDCPLQYKFYKELEFAEVRTGGVLGGTLLHQTIEDIHKAVLKGEESSLTDANIKEWYDNNYFLLSKNLRAYLHQAQLDALYKQILRYRDRHTNEWDRIKEAEVDVSLVKDKYILKGTIDLVKGENDTVELIDFKSGDKPDVNSPAPKVKRQLQQYRRQLEVYAHLVEERTGHKVSKMHLYYPKEESGNPEITWKHDKTNVDNTIKIFDEVVEKIESKNYDMSHIVKNEKQCGDCDMRFYCNPKCYKK